MMPYIYISCVVIFSVLSGINFAYYMMEIEYYKISLAASIVFGIQALGCAFLLVDLVDN